MHAVTSMAPSSSGLGRWPLTPETRVRVPLGSVSLATSPGGEDRGPYFCNLLLQAQTIPCYVKIPLPSPCEIILSKLPTLLAITVKKND
jgi:hypothetical protein